MDGRKEQPGAGLMMIKGRQAEDYNAVIDRSTDLAILFQGKSPLMWLLCRVLLFSQRTTVHAKRTGKISGHAGSREFRGDETEHSFAEIVALFPFTRVIWWGWIGQTAQEGVLKRFERES